MQGQSQLSTPLNSQLTFHIYAATKGLGGGRQNWLCPRAREALGTPLRQGKGK